MADNSNGAEGFSPSSPIKHRQTGASDASSSRRRSSSAATATGRLRSASQKLMEANVPSGMWAATGSAAAKAPSLSELRRGSYGSRMSSDTSIPKFKSTAESPSPGPAILHEDVAEHVPSAQQKKLDKRSGEDDDGFPANIFGRGELDDQSFVRGQRASVISNRVPKLAVRGRDSVAAADPHAGGESSEKQAAGDENAGEGTEPFPALDDDDDDDLDDLVPRPKRNSKNINAMLGREPAVPMPVRDSSETRDPIKPEPNEEGIYPNGYSFPPPKPWSEAMLIGTKAFLRFTFTPLGFLIVVYGLNVVAWGGMLFLLLCNASPAMCTLGSGLYDCNNIDSPRRIWIEIDSQILNALFCVTGFGLIPWRFRDLFYWIKWRVAGQEAGLRKLAGYHNGWFRLPGSDRLPVKSYNESELYEDVSNPALPLPLKKAPGVPLTGARAPPTALWKMDFVIWAFVINTFLQAVLSGFMWGLNRYDRPSWSTGLFVALACVVAGMGGLMQFFEGKAIKKVEGIPLDTDRVLEDIEKDHSRAKKKSRASEKVGAEQVEEKKAAEPAKPQAAESQ